MGFFAGLFSGKPDLNEEIRTTALTLWEAVPKLVRTIRDDVYKTDHEMSIGTDPEIHSALIHFASRVALHTGGGKFQDAIYASLRDKITETYATAYSKYLKISAGRNVSPRALQQDFNELVRNREIEYAKYSGGYGQKDTREGSLVWAIASHIHGISGIKAKDDAAAILGIGNRLVLALAELKLDKRLEHLSAIFHGK